ncbi:MAG TPA: DUF3043 domain-containing protein [Actinobacteria bacterium]|nr:DUF3043 domain-containing protein [Actinomycetota bacterium]
MFGRSSKSSQSPTPEVDAPTTGKGHATPSRREAEAARKQRVKIPAKTNTKEGKKAAKERVRAERERSRRGMMAGEERFMPARDQGPARAFARDFVDSRFTMAEYFILIAVGVLVLGFIPIQPLQFWVTVVFFAFAALLVIDTIIMVILLNRQAIQQFPEAKDRKGLSLYAILRVMQLRRLRLPPPRVKRGGMPR